MNSTLFSQILLSVSLLLSSLAVTAQIDFFGSNTHNINDSDNPAYNLDAPGSVTSAVVNGKTMVIATGYDENGISVFELSAAGVLSQTGLTPALANITDNGSLNIVTPIALATAAVGATTFLIVAGENDNGLSLFTLTPLGISQAGLVTPNVDDAGPTNLNGPNFITTAVSGGKTYVVVAGSDGLSVFELTAAGELTQAGIAQANINDSDNPAYNFSGGAYLTSAVVSGETFIVAGSYADSGLSVFKLNASGLTQAGLTPAEANIDDNGVLRLANIVYLITAEVDGKTYIIPGSGTDDGLSIFELTSTGLSQAGIANANISDDATVYLDRVEALTTITSGGRSFVIAADNSDKGISAFELTSSGLSQNGLTNPNIGDSGVLNLDEIYSMTSTQVGSKTFVIVPGAEEDGLSVFEVQNLPVSPPAAHHEIPTMPWYSLIFMMFGTLCLAFKNSQLIRWQ